MDDTKNIRLASTNLHKKINTIIDLIIQEVLKLSEEHSVEEIINNNEKTSDWTEETNNWKEEEINWKKLLKIIITEFKNLWEENIIKDILERIIKNSKATKDSKATKKSIRNYLDLKDKNTLAWKITWLFLYEYNIFYNKLYANKAWIDLKTLVNKRWENLEWMLCSTLENMHENKENWLLIITWTLNDKESIIKIEFNFNNWSTFTETLFEVINNIKKVEGQKWTLEIIDIKFESNTAVEKLQKTITVKKPNVKRKKPAPSTNQSATELRRKKTVEKKQKEIGDDLALVNSLIENIPNPITLAHENQVEEARNAVEKAKNIKWIEDSNFIDLKKLTNAEAKIIELKLEEKFNEILIFLINTLEINDILSIINQTYNWTDIDNFINQNDLDKKIYDKIYDFFIITWNFTKIWKEQRELIQYTFKIYQERFTLFISNSTLANNDIKRSLLWYVEDSLNELDKENSELKTPVTIN